MTATDAAVAAGVRALPLVLVPFAPIWGRLIVALLLGSAVAPSLLPLALPSGWMTSELACGALLALCAAVPLYAARAAGLLVTGASVQGATLHTQVFSRGLGLWLLATLAIAGGVGTTLRAWMDSYAVLPLGTAQTTRSFAALVATSGRVVTLGVELALPIVGSLALVDLVAGFIARAEPRARLGLAMLRPLCLALLVVVGIARPALDAVDLPRLLSGLR